MAKSFEKIQTHENESLVKTPEGIVSANFSKKASTYEQYALAQKFAAQSLHDKIVAKASTLNPVSILEIGCGTGLLSRHLAAQFPFSKIDFLDPSPSMLQRCKQNLNEHLALKDSFQNHQYIGKSIEDYLADQIQFLDKYKLIASSFALHWVSDLPSVMNRLINMLEIGGQFFFAYPTNRSFPEWKTACNMLSLPFSGNKFPAVSDLETMFKSKKIRLSWSEYCFKFNLPSSIYFFREIKNLGAETQIKSDQSTRLNRPLSVPEFRLLIKTWDENFSNKIESPEIGVEASSSIDCTYWLLEGIITRLS